jgi:DNA-binding response OmpR family regulator
MYRYDVVHCEIVMGADPSKKVGASPVVSRNLVVVIDDSPDALETAARYLKSKGVEVITSTHGFDLASILARRAPDAVVLDVMLPALAGSTLAQIVRKHAPNTPIVFYSAIPEDKGKDLISSVPRSMFIPKTQGVAALYQAIEKVIEKVPSAAGS